MRLHIEYCFFTMVIKILAIRIANYRRLLSELDALLRIGDGSVFCWACVVLHYCHGLFAFGKPTSSLIRLPNNGLIKKFWRSVSSDAGA